MFGGCLWEKSNNQPKKHFFKGLLGVGQACCGRLCLQLIWVCYIHTIPWVIEISPVKVATESVNCF
jgi:hypothetical protein